MDVTVELTAMQLAQGQERAWSLVESVLSIASPGLVSVQVDDDPNVNVAMVVALAAIAKAGLEASATMGATSVDVMVAAARAAISESVHTTRRQALRVV